MLTLQNNIKECALILTQVQSLSLPRSTHLSPKVLSTPRLRTAGCHAGNSTVLHVLSQLYTLI